ncbi:MAG: hypothetical protein II604_00385 [Bacteroidales bacterium]|nr:hypothetical protein [Bacteroidales bacterium]
MSNKKPQLYIKNEKGRYVPYTPPKPEISDTLYRKIGKKYYPAALSFGDHFDSLSDGIYVIREDGRGHLRSLANAEYIQEVFVIDKVSGNYRITAEQYASLEDYEEFAYRELQKFKNDRASIGISECEKIQCIIGSVFKFSAILKEKMEKEKTHRRNPSDGNNPPF